MAEDKAVLISLTMNFDTKSTSRNVEEKQFAIDISENEDFNSLNVKLAPNNDDGTNSKSKKLIEEIESFFYLYSPYSTEVTFTQEDNTKFTLKVSDITMIQGGFKQIVIKNLNTEQPAAIRVIYS